MDTALLLREEGFSCVFIPRTPRRVSSQTCSTIEKKRSDNLIFGDVDDLVRSP